MNSRDLDQHITGNYGEDYFASAERCWCGATENEKCRPGCTADNEED